MVPDTTPEGLLVAYSGTEATDAAADLWVACPCWRQSPVGRGAVPGEWCSHSCPACTRRWWRRTDYGSNISAPPANIYNTATCSLYMYVSINIDIHIASVKLMTARCKQVDHIPTDTQSSYLHFVHECVNKHWYNKYQTGYCQGKQVHHLRMNINTITTYTLSRCTVEFSTSKESPDWRHLVGQCSSPHTP